MSRARGRATAFVEREAPRIRPPEGLLVALIALDRRAGDDLGAIDYATNAGDDAHGHALILTAADAVIAARGAADPMVQRFAVALLRRLGGLEPVEPPPEVDA